MQLPRRISPVPLVDTIAEIRFDAKIPANAVFGVVYQALQDEYSTYQDLPVLQVPEFIKQQDPSFRYSAHYKLTSERFVVQVGPRALTVGPLGPYIGWDSFLPEIRRVLAKVSNLGIISRLHRYSLRYINFFEGDVLPRLKLKITLKGEHINPKETSVRLNIEEQDFYQLLHIRNDALHSRDGTQVSGSLVDIDTISRHELEATVFFDDVSAAFDLAHTSTKNRFFGLLSDDFLRSLNPEY